MSLKNAAELIGMEKGETPKELLEKEGEYTKEEITRIIPYMIQDTKITLALVLKMKEALAEEGLHIRRLYTKNQVAISAVLHRLKKSEDNTEHIFWDKEIVLSLCLVSCMV